MSAYPDLSIPLRNAIVNGNGVTDLLGQFTAGDNVFTSRPVPATAPYPMIIVGPDIGPHDAGGLSDQRLSIMRDIGVYGMNSGDSKSQYRDVETTARLIYDLFHRKPRSITVTGWAVIQIWAGGPVDAPTGTHTSGSQDVFVARIVPLTITLIAQL